MSRKPLCQEKSFSLTAFILNDSKSDARPGVLDSARRGVHYGSGILVFGKFYKDLCNPCKIRLNKQVRLPFFGYFFGLAQNLLTKPAVVEERALSGDKLCALSEQGKSALLEKTL